MGTPSVNDLDSLLSSLNQLKPPGASKTKIATITSLCVNNIQVESSVVQSFYKALKKAPATHKLGALYVIDSVVRQWMVQAKAAGQDLNIEGRGEPGTYPAAIKRVTELMPALFEDILKCIPSEQKPKLENMVSIWERGNTFPAAMLADFKTKLSGTSDVPPASAPAQDAAKLSSSKYMAPIPSKPVGTPVGLPPRNLYENGLIPGRPAPSEGNGMSQNKTGNPMTTAANEQPSSSSSGDVNSILAALSRAAPPTQSMPHPAAPAPQPIPTQQQQQLPPNIAALFAQQQLPAAPTPPANPYGYGNSAAPAMQMAGYQPPNPYSSMPPQQAPSIPQGYPMAPLPQVAPPPQQQADPLAPLRGLLPESILNDTQKLIPALKLLQDLQKEGVPPQNWGPVLKAFEDQFHAPAAPAPAPTNVASNPAYNNSRGRSRSPDRGGSRGRGSPVYGAYDPNSRRQAPDDDQGGRGRKYRQRSPVARNSPAATAMNGKPMQRKYIDYDPSLPPDNIKVLSRTLFVGGASGSQQEIQDLFARFGAVQTCISNRDKRHAFVKMTTRTHALAAKSGMEELQARNDREVMNIARQTKWGVGFGPRECCDYARGESIIPIHKLTEADMKWLLTAEFGGTGGQQVAGGMVLEEPDIEIGAGVSSKAMSKRIGPTDPSAFSNSQGGNGGGGGPGKRGRDDRRGGGRHGHRSGANHSNYDQGYGGGGGGYSGVSGGQHQQQQMDPYGGYARPEPVAVATPPAVPGFGFSFGGLAGNGTGSQGGTGYR